MSWGELIFDIEAKARRYELIFLQVGAAFEPVRQDLAEISGIHAKASSYLGMESPQSPSLIVLDEVETAARSRHFSLGRLRERVTSDIKRGHVFVLVSRTPRASYDVMAGSDLIADCRQVFLPLVEMRDGDCLTRFPASDGDNAASLLYSILSDVGSDVVYTLAQALWEDGLSPNESLLALSRHELEGLRGAGLVLTDNDALSWSVDGAWKMFRFAVASVSSEYVQADAGLSNAFVDLWVLERLLRNIIRRALLDKHGAGWRASCMKPSLALEVVERARRDSQPSAASVKELRDPLEWLSITELLDLREDRSLGELGLESYLWTKIRSDVVSIRNRAAHMRVIDKRAAATARSWRKLIEQRFVG